VCRPQERLEGISVAERLNMNTRRTWADCRVATDLFLKQTDARLTLYLRNAGRFELTGPGVSLLPGKQASHAYLVDTPL